MNIRIRACDLPLEIECPKTLAPRILSLLKGYQSNAPGESKLTLHLPLRSNSSGASQRSLNVDFWKRPIDRYVLKEWTNRSLQIDLKSKQVEVLSAALGHLLLGALSDHQGLILHAAFLVSNGLGYIFIGRSGAGKSTLAQNASKLSCVHDDRVALRSINGKWWAYGTPLLDNFGRPGKKCAVPLVGAHLIKKAKRITKKPISQKETMVLLSEHVLIPDGNPTIKCKLCENFLLFVNDVMVEELGFGKTSDVSCVVLK